LEGGEIKVRIAQEIAIIEKGNRHLVKIGHRQQQGRKSKTTAKRGDPEFLICDCD
jgi:hypothetical protein